ncbi:MAG: hypothetical protein GKR87_09405 [Kiritimatiellae bacterium]|nr:hypothetical protein [Kiritimatiellia bacterium]
MSIRVEGARPYKQLRDPLYGNRYLCFDFSNVLPSNRNIKVEVKFDIHRLAYRVFGKEADPPLLSRKLYDRFLAPDRLVPIDGEIGKEADRIVGNIKDPLPRARKLYDHIVNTLVYDKSGKGWGQGNAVYACDIRKGNCTDFHSLFIGEARHLGIPSRFAIGFPLPEMGKSGPIRGYHCWAEFYVQKIGWVPIDASEAFKFPEKKEMFFWGTRCPSDSLHNRARYISAFIQCRTG